MLLVFANFVKTDNVVYVVVHSLSLLNNNYFTAKLHGEEQNKGKIN